MTIIHINDRFQEVEAKEAMRLVLAGQAVLVEHDHFLAYRYARDVIGGPWPPGEAAISSHPGCARFYARLCRSQKSVDKAAPRPYNSGVLGKGHSEC